MADVLTPAQRRLNMSRIRGRDTKPEIALRRLLHAAGFRFRLHAPLPGKPDLVLPRYRAVVFVHGCFWHGHDCPMFRMPATRREFWETKIAANKARDEAAVAALREGGWRVLTVWECAMRGPRRYTPAEITLHCKAFLTGHVRHHELRGNETLRKTQES